MFVSSDAVDPTKSWILEQLSKIKLENSYPKQLTGLCFHLSLKIQGITAVSTALPAGKSSGKSTLGSSGILL